MSDKYIRCMTDEDYKRKEKLIEYIEPIYPLVEPDVEYCFASKDGYTFEFINKAGQMGWIVWIQIKKNDELYAEFIETNCNIFYKQEATND